jgi:hypothetical protein
MAAARPAGSYAAANSVSESNCPGLACSSRRGTGPARVRCRDASYLASLLREAMEGQMPAPAEALAAMAASDDPVERVAAATGHLLRLVHGFQGATRAMIAATITRPASADSRPGAALRPDRPRARPA